MRIRTAAAATLLGCLVALAGCLFSNDPIAEFTISPSPAYGRPPLTRTFNAGASRSPSGSIASYAWNFGDGETASGSKTTHTFTEKGIHPVTLTVTDSAGQVGRVSHSVQILGLLPAAYFDYSPQGATTQIPVEFDASRSDDPDGEIVQWLWSFGDGTSGEGMIIEHLFPKGLTKAYEVTLTVVDDDGDRDSVTRKVPIYGCDCG